MKPPAGARCYVCQQTPPPIVLSQMSRRCTRYHDGPPHTWWVCSAACAFALGEDAGSGVLEVAIHGGELAPVAGGGR